MFKILEFYYKFGMYYQLCQIYWVTILLLFNMQVGKCEVVCRMHDAWFGLIPQPILYSLLPSQSTSQLILVGVSTCYQASFYLCWFFFFCKLIFVLLNIVNVLIVNLSFVVSTNNFTNFDLVFRLKYYLQQGYCAVTLT